jgi:hypothetical protein
MATSSTMTIGAPSTTSAKRSRLRQSSAIPISARIPTTQ